MEESGVVAGNQSQFVEIPACGEVHLEALDFIVAPGGAEALAAAVRRAKGEAQPASLSGVVTVGTEQPAAGARVHITKSDGQYFTTAIAGTDGEYRVGLPPGDYNVTAVLDGHAIAGPANVTMNSADRNLDIRLDPPGTLYYSITDEESNPLPAKIIVFPQTALPELPRSFGEARYPGGAAAVLFETEGSGEILLPAGSYRVFASRGYFHETDEEQVTLTSAGTANVNLVLPQVVDRTGYLCADFHQHSVWSPDSWTPPETVVAANIAEGLDIIVSTDHDWIADFQYVIENLGLTARARAFGGEEITSYEYGHFNPFPLTRVPGQRNDGAIENYYRSPEEVFADALDDPLHPVLQVNHPRSGGLGDYFNYVGLDPQTCRPTKHTEWWSELWNVIEIFNGSDFRSNESTVDNPQSVGDWFGLLNCGKRFTATGNSDSHNPIKSELGYPRNCLYFGFDDPAMVTAEALTGTIRELKNLVTGGPFVTATINGAGMGETASAPGGRANLLARVQAPLWMKVDRMRIFVSGTEMEPIDETTADPLDPVTRFEGTIPIDTGGRDGWVIVVVEGDEPMDPVAWGKLPFAAINPIFIDAT